MVSPVKKLTYLPLLIILASCLLFCSGKKRTGLLIDLPYPDDTTAVYYQSRIDSSEYDWFVDAKDAATSFVNEYNMVDGGFSAHDAILIGEGIFYATVEVELPDKILVLELERPFKHLGRRSIWQVVEMKEKNPRMGCPKIAEFISKTFGIKIDKDIVRRILEKHYKPEPNGGGP